MTATADRIFATSCCCAALFAALCLDVRRAHAADTVEPFAVGATDVDFYMGAEGIGLDRADQAFFGDIMLGYGIVDRLSAYLGTTFAGDGRLNGAGAEPYTGLYGTVFESPHVDLDLFLHVALGDADVLHVAPSFELNFDADPDQLSWGVYLRNGVDVGGAGPDMDIAGPGDLVWSMETTLGAYWTVHEGHQLLVELDAVTPLHPRDEGRPVDFGGIALGYNVAIHEAVELINHVWLDVPQTADEPVAVAMVAGFIATLP